MSKSGQINKYILLKNNIYFNGRVLLYSTEIWRLDNKNAHLHRVYKKETNKFEYPEENKCLKKNKFYREHTNTEGIIPKRTYELIEFETKEEYYDGMFLEML